MSCKPCGDHCCGHSFRSTVKVCAGIDVVLGLICFISCLAVLLSFDSIMAAQINYILKRGSDEETKSKIEAIEELGKMKDTLWRALLANVIAYGMQFVLGIFLFVAAVQKSRPMCIVWIILTIPQVPFCLILRIVEILLVLSFMNEILEDEATPHLSLNTKSHSNNGQVFPSQNCENGSKVDQTQFYHGTVNAPIQHTQGYYEPPPKYEYPVANSAYKGFTSPVTAANVHRL